MLIRKLGIDDLSLYKAIRLELLSNAPTNFGSSFDEEYEFNDAMWERRLTNKNATSFGAFIDEEIVGVVVVMENPRSKMKHLASIHSMYVKPKYRKNTFAEQLLNHSFKYLRSKNVRRVNLSVVTTNHGAVSLYKKLGFIEYGIEKETIKLDNQFYDLLLMSKML